MVFRSEKIDMTTAYILGHKGFVGSAIERLLQKLGVDYKGINRENYNSLKGTECDIFINAAGNSKKYLAEKDPALDFEINVNQTMKTLIDFKFRHYVFISTSDVYNDFSDPSKNSEDSVIESSQLSNYGFAKWMAEQLVKRCPSWTIFRLGGMVGQGLKKNAVYDLLAKGSLWIHPESRYHYMNTDDVAKIVWDLREKKGEIFNVCGDEPATLKEVADELGISLPQENYSNPKGIYYINISKLKALVEVPKTKDTILNFARDFKA